MENTERENKLTPFEKAYFTTVQNISLRIFDRYCEGEIKGIENILNLSSGFILACNHSSYLDWLILYSVFKNRFQREIVFLAKEKLFKSPLWQKLIKAANCIMVTDTGVSLSSLRKIYKTIRTNGIVGIFPEGTRSHNGELLQAKDGIAKIAMLTGAPVIPVGIIGLYEVWPRHKLFPSGFNKCVIKIGEPIFIEKMLASEATNCGNITKNIMVSIGSLINKKYIHVH
ncbi:hypothetical protein A2276_07120 [candidate division WOR-1 bacterium RIFOXYA12_FULL_43_27]|uniref:Phospholipid/glycerol acyltransferase domain-containing protein n=1 Tax=candidate division WOR-1 bacterium RIFOXYC2_FULL_46_14 TaxID=1802587 RepID=A0A1F4U3C1_UNCSA|nr:MAG: hypothetical protein A2276_07120 [candidate division WOR-1 bacterium RIFOXYA12_FULL_43_27]OGC18856.1 MAG: hypothetical protein A2292_07975 [candidate division WOR-1 bacterium RIFOXYB2_FULL_46_45]OGC28997.1 MAG: hypothetical protein A2232_03040 [candidate division WOR-1 bacterium RIFOXYA2_FULL_46_56]OGC39379.1 MAG: hypothetical protein A2438_06655 [candidate division WOR-1 bacterium RIFOXYC2_FULL_46_14]